MPKIITTNFGSIADALNKLIINEVKAALRLLPGQRIEAKPSEAFPNYTPPLCHVVVSPNDNYEPRDISVLHVWIARDGQLNVRGLTPDGQSEAYEEDYADWLNLRDFQYLIEQCREQIPDREDGLPTYLTSYIAMNNLREAAEKTIKY